MRIRGLGSFLWGKHSYLYFIIIGGRDAFFSTESEVGMRVVRVMIRWLITVEVWDMIR